MTREASSEAMRRIGLSLKSWRAMGGVTADELAEAIGVSRDTLSRVERGDSSVGVGTVLDVCVRASRQGHGSGRPGEQRGWQDRPPARRAQAGSQGAADRGTGLENQHELV